MNIKEKKEERFELRLSKSNKRKFEKAAELIGHPSLASFVSSVVIEKANEIIEKEEEILADERDKEIFFNALMKDNEPNEALQKAARDYWNHNTAQ